MITKKQIGNNGENRAAEFLKEKGIYSAMNLDGGSSSIMTYKGETINKPSSTNHLGRYLPNAFIVEK